MTGTQASPFNTTTQYKVAIAQTLLENYFRPRVPLGGGSKTGAQLQKLWLYAAKMRPCPECKRREKRFFEWLDKRSAYYRAFPGGDPYEQLVPPPDSGSDDCPRCKGVKFVEGRARAPKSDGLEARPKGSSVQGTNAREPDGVAFAAEASRVMRKLVASDPDSADVLFAYHGPAGDFAEENYGTRLLAVVPLTDTYKGMILDPVDEAETEEDAEEANATTEAEVPRVLRRMMDAQSIWRRERADLMAATAERIRNEETVRDKIRRAAGPTKLCGCKQDPCGCRPTTLARRFMEQLKAWRTTGNKERQTLWDYADAEAQWLFDIAMYQWELCCDA